MTRVVALTLTLIAVACGAEVQPEPTGDVPMYEPEPVVAPVVTDRDPPRLYDEAAGSAATPVVTAGAGGAGGAGGSPEPLPAGAAAPEPPVAGAPAMEPEPAGAPAPEPVAGSAAPEPVNYTNVCKIGVGQRYAGHTIGCDDGSRSAYPYFVVRWKTPSSEAASGFASVGCSERVEHPCVTGEACRVEDTREGQPAQTGVCQ